MEKLASLKFNDPAPNVELSDTEGNPLQLASLWQDKVLVLAFTRHFGCPQCKDMTDRLVEVQPQLLEKGLTLVLVTHASPAETKEYCANRAPSVRCLADPERAAYQAYGLGRGTAWQTLISPNIWKSNRRLEKTKGYKPEVPPPGQDALQMSGTFIIGTDGRIRLPYYYEDIADHPPVDLLLHGLMGLQWSEPFEKPLHE